jgi:ectoine hydroxylase-related dioxygenase (phytanoyl-CoA dioxygenase family)
MGTRSANREDDNPMDMAAALSQMGVRSDTLTDAERTSIDRDGYLRVDDAITPAQAAAMKDRLQELVDLEGEDAGIEVHKEKGTDRLGDLVNKDPLFEICFSHPRVLACAQQMISGDFRLSALNSRTALPGDGLTELHADSGSRVKPGEYENAMSIWFLVDFTEENGPTRVIPGSHRAGKLAADVLDDPRADHPDEVHLTGKAGTVYVFNAHIWHGGTKNNSSGPRPAAFEFFGRRDIPQYIDQRKYIRPETYERLSDAGRYILDVEGMTEFTPDGFDRTRVAATY